MHRTGVRSCSLRGAGAALVAAWLAAQAGGVYSQAYPSRPIRIVVQFSAGSQADLLARAVGTRMAEQWGQQVVVDNRPSAGGTVAGSIVASATPDGHTLMMVSPGHAVSASLYARLPYDPVKDFHGASQVASGATALIIAPSQGIRTVKELIAAARNAPGKVTFGSAGIGSGTHLAGEQLKLLAKVDMTHVPYKGTPEAITDTLAGRIHVFFAALPPAMGFIKDGRLIALAVSTTRRSPVLPDIPTIDESGVPGYEFDAWYGLIAPARAPRPVLDRISDEVARILAIQDVSRGLLAQGLVPRPSRPEAFQAMIASEVVKFGRIVKASGARID
jgi:tripartite-type tricarboxylate transporter receptor subunit TctC